MSIAPQDLVIISLGSNLGNSTEILREAMSRLEAFADGPVLRSSIWETHPVDCPPGSPLFLNAAAGFVPRHGTTPEDLLAKLKSMETQAGRKEKRILNEPRPLDLDIITFRSEQRHSPELVIPHPRAHLRAFVMGPVAEIAPALRIPGQQWTVSQLFADLSRAETSPVRRRSPNDPPLGKPINQ